MNSERFPNGVNDFYSAYDVELEQHLCTLFNLNRFEEAGDILNKSLSLDAAQRSFYDHLLAGYSSWDKFHHKDAFMHVKEIKPTQFAPHKEFLGKLKSTPEPEQTPYLIADLLHNASRRIAGQVRRRCGTIVSCH